MAGLTCFQGLSCEGPNTLTTPSVAAGAFIAAMSDLTFNLYGYAAVLGNDFLTALYLILVKNTPATAGLTTTGLLFYNAGARSLFAI